MDKKGMSGIITVIVIIGMALVAIGIVWYVVNEVLGDQTESISLSEKCLDVYIQVKSVGCDGSSICNVTLSRRPGGDDIGGLKMAFKNDAGNASSIIDSPGNIEPLQTVTRTGIDSEISSATNLEFTIYFNSTSGTEQICPNTNTYEI